MQKIFPWQQKNWQYLVKRKKFSQMPHALLIQGQGGLGKTHFANCLAELLLCEDNTDKESACGSCKSCQLLTTNNHPDLVIVQAEEEGKPIKIDQIREVVSWLNNTSHQGGYKAVIIESAEMLNIAAANALLKTLEEPDQNTVIILVSAHPMLLKATIRSRCQDISINVPEYSIAKEWLSNKIHNSDVELLLSLVENSPLKALELAQGDFLKKRQDFFNELKNLYLGKTNPFYIVSKKGDLSLDDFLMILMHTVNDLIKITLGDGGHIVNKDQLENFINYAQKTDLERLFSYKDFLTEIRQYLVRKINLNQQLAIENLLIGWQELY